MPTGRKEGKREKEKEREKERERRQHDLGLLSAGRPLYSDVRKRRDGGGGGDATDGRRDARTRGICLGKTRSAVGRWIVGLSQIGRAHV